MQSTQVAIIGAGPAGLLLSWILRLRGIKSVVLEAKSRAYCEARIRAGILEQGTVDMLRAAGVGERLDREAIFHHGIDIAFAGDLHRIDVAHYTSGRLVTAYGQTEIVKDLFRHHGERGSEMWTETEVVGCEDMDGDRPRVRYRRGDGTEGELACDFIAGCDGFWGISRQSIPVEQRTSYDLVYPYSWLAILADAPPVNEVVIYGQHDRGFSLQSMRSATVSRLYLQVDNEDELANWSDDQIWNEIDIRLGCKQNRGPILQRGITPMRSFVSEPMRFGRLFLAGDAGHIVPPTGAKGLNLAVADVSLLSHAFISFYCNGTEEDLAHYSERVLRRIWKVERFSWFCTTLFHRDHRHGEFQHRLRKADLDYLLSSDAAKTSFSENYAGLPIERWPEL